MKGLITVAIYIIISSFVDTSYLHGRTAKAILTSTEKQKKTKKNFRYEDVPKVFIQKLFVPSNVWSTRSEPILFWFLAVKNTT